MINESKYLWSIIVGITFLINILFVNCLVVQAENTPDGTPVNNTSVPISEDQKAERKMQKPVEFIRSGAALKKRAVVEKPLHIKELSAVKSKKVKKIGIEMTDKIKPVERKEIKAIDEDGVIKFKRIKHKKLKPAEKSQRRRSEKGVKIQKAKDIKKLSTIRKAVK